MKIPYSLPPPYFKGFSPISQKLDPTAKNGFQIPIFHKKMHNCKENMSFLCP